MQSESKEPNMALNLAPFGRWTALKRRRLALRWAPDARTRSCSGIGCDFRLRDGGTRLTRRAAGRTHRMFGGGGLLSHHGRCPTRHPSGTRRQQLRSSHQSSVAPLNFCVSHTG
jgi:hypothetical protein